MKGVKMGIGLNVTNGTFQVWGALGTETSQGARMDESKGRESTSYSVSSANSSEERVSLEVEGSITRDADIGDMFNMAFASLPLPEMKELKG